MVVQGKRVYPAEETKAMLDLFHPTPDLAYSYIPFDETEPV